ncbi:hypothetical protein BDFG_07745 [Blastomyces dermatitidis ATCC 26199]|nr:hypothetical protein BDFG_07745 [Blastomyces dermatitidis ATCC 26199]
MNSFNVAGSLPIHTAPSQISIVDVFFAGFTAISASIQELLAGNLNRYARLLCICGALLVFVRYAYRYLIDTVETYFISTFTVPYYNEAYDMLIAWVSDQPFAHKARSSLVSVGGQRRAYANVYSNAYTKKPLHFSPWNGSFFFLYKNHLLRFQCLQKEGSDREEVSVSCIGRSSETLREFFSDCRTRYLNVIQKKTSVFEHRDGEWRKTKAKDIRPISTVIMNEEEKMAVLKDIEDFLDEGARGWYARRGIPYRRGFLLYGPPGTGKSSFSLSVAGRFELDIYVLNLSGIDDSRLNSLFAQLPAHCVILLEDIDAAGTTRVEDPEIADAGQAVAGPLQKSKSQGKVSLSALLNALDGVSSQEGRLLIMTTNHIEHLDDALIRPGRVDRKVLFQLADKKMCSRLFCTVFKRSDGDHRNPGKEIDDETIQRLADEFAAKVPDQVFSPAEILLSFLLERKQSPTDAVADVENWVAKASKERGKVNNYARARAILNPTDSFEYLAEST